MLESCHDTKIAIAWSGLPAYAARLIHAAVKNINCRFIIIGSKPSVPIQGMEEIVGQPIHWVEVERTCSWQELGLEVPDILIQTGWRNRAFNDLGRAVRAQGGRVISMIDNSWKNSLRQWIGAVIFRLRYRRWFDQVWVPGASGERLCRFLGMPAERIGKGMYGADPQIFFPGETLSLRPKQFLFVGQFIHRKGVDLLIEAFGKFRQEHPDWRLLMVGQGELQEQLQGSGIEVQSFQQPEAIAKLMRQSRFLILPSRLDHWGLVVHEAALSGCGIITSNNVAAVADLLEPGKNGMVFPSGCSQALYQSLVESAAMDEKALYQAEQISQAKASLFGPQRWAEMLKTLIETTQIREEAA